MTNYIRSLKFALLVLYCYVYVSSSVAQGDNSGNIIYLREEEGVHEVIDYTTGHSTTHDIEHCIRFSPHFDYVAAYSLQNPEQITFTRLTTGTVITQVSWQAEWGNRQNNPSFCSVTNQWVDNTVFRVSSIQASDQFYDINSVTGQVEGPFTANSMYPELPLQDPGVAEFGLGVASTFSPSSDQAIYSQCEQADCNQTRYVLYDTRSQQVQVELLPPDFGFYYARLIAGDVFFSWSYDERYIAISSADAVLAVYDNSSAGWVDLNFLPSGFREIVRTIGGWNWSPNNSQIAFGAQQLGAMGYLFDSGIMIIDLAARTYRVFQIADNVFTDFSLIIRWLPSAEGLLIVNSNGVLYRLDFSSGSLELVDDHVSGVLAWYPAIE